MLKVLGKISLIDKVIIPFMREDLSSFKSSFGAPKCAICGKNHNRCELYIIEEDGVRYTAGKNCMEKAFGKEAAKKAISDAKVEEKFISSHSFTLINSVIAALQLHNEMGFVKGESTLEYKARYYDLLNEALKSDEREQYEATAQKVVDYYRNLETTNSFLANVVDLMRNTYHSEKVLGLFPAAVNSYHKAIEYQHQKEIAEQHKLENAAMTSFYGEEGVRSKNVMVKCEVIDCRKVEGRSFGYWDDGEYHQTFLKDNQGHVFVWNNCFCTKIDMLPHYAIAGSKVMLQAFTVKKHFIGKLGHVTSITRPKYEITKLVTEF